MRRKWIFIAPAALAGIAALVALGGEAVKLLWNALLPSLFGWPVVTFWQALGLLVLTRILFGGIGRHGCGRRWRVKDEDGELLRQRIRERLRERWDADRPAAEPKPQ